MFKLSTYIGALMLMVGSWAVAAENADVSKLAEQLKTGQAEQQIQAAKQLAALGSEAEPALPALTEALQSDDSQVRAYAANAIGQIGQAARQVAPELIKLMTDEDAVVRREVRDALLAIEAPREMTRPLMLRALNNAEPADAAAALATLAELGEAVVPELCQALDDPRACYWASLALADMGPKAKAAVPQLAKLLDSEDPDVRMQALITLGAIGPAAQQTVPHMIELLGQDPFESVQYAAAYALGCVAKPQQATDELVRALDSEDPFLRVAAAWSLLRLADSETPATKKAVETVIQSIQADDPEVRSLAAQAMADDQVPSQVVRRAMRQALEGIDQPRALERIADALASIGPKVVPACIRSLKREDKLRPYAMLILIKLGSQAAPAVPALIETLEDPEPVVRREAAFTLGAIGPEADEAVPALIELLEDEDQDVQHAACYALGKIGPGAKEALRPLHKAMQNEDQFTKVAAIWASLKIAPDNPRLKEVAVPILTEALDHQAAHVRAEVAGLLGDIGGPAKAAIPELKKLSEDSDRQVRRAAAMALDQIQKASQ
jgi:HEAT repeat protein